MTTTTRFAAAILALVVSAVPASAGVTYHLDTGLPPGTGMYAQVEFASPPASDTAGWTAVLGPGVVLELTVYNLVAPVPNGLSAAAFSMGVENYFLPVGSTTGAVLDVGGIVGGGWAERQLANVLFDFGPGGAGSVDAVYNQRPFGQEHGGSGVLHVVEAGTWVLGAATAPVHAPEPRSIALLATGLGFVAGWWLVGRR